MVKESGWGKKTVEVEQAGGWRFLIFSGLFFTRLFVTEDKNKGTVEFKLAEQGMMKVLY